MGCDGDIGGTSTVHLDLDENPEHNATLGKTATGLFWGEMRLDVKPGYANKIRGGYAGFRNMVRAGFLPGKEVTHHVGDPFFLSNA
jgi:NADH dehydrogenase [ubiquinone] 1 alpha subcomplex assembly factor 1